MPETANRYSPFPALIGNRLNKLYTFRDRRRRRPKARRPLPIKPIEIGSGVFWLWLLTKLLIKELDEGSLMSFMIKI